MCGVPWHAAEGYVSQLLNKGYKIAFCNQVEDPRAAKGLVDRAVTRVYTPGTAIDDVSLEPKGHTYLGALFWNAETDRGGLRVGGAYPPATGRGCTSKSDRNCGDGPRKSRPVNCCFRRTRKCPPPLA